MLKSVKFVPHKTLQCHRLREIYVYLIEDTGSVWLYFWQSRAGSGWSHLRWYCSVAPADHLQKGVVGNIGVWRDGAHLHLSFARGLYLLPHARARPMGDTAAFHHTSRRQKRSRGRYFSLAFLNTWIYPSDRHGRDVCPTHLEGSQRLQLPRVMVRLSRRGKKSHCSGGGMERLGGLSPTRERVRGRESGKGW